MPLSFYPFDSGAGATVQETQWIQMARLWLATGVVKGNQNELAVFADSTGMQVKVPTGQGWVEGQFVNNDALATLVIAAADATNPRIDLVVLRKDNVAKTFALAVLTGTPGATPAAPTPTQNASTWELPLAEVRVNATATTITSGNVTDRRVLVQNVDASATQTITNKDITATALHNTGATTLDGTLVVSSTATLNGTVGGTGAVGAKFAPRFWAGAAAWAGGATAPTYGTYNTVNEYAYWDFPDGSNTYAVLNFMLPTNFAGGTVRFKVYWFAPTGTGGVTWAILAALMAVGADPRAAWSQRGFTSGTASTNLVMTEVDWPGLTAADAGKVVNMALQRVTTDTGDTLAAAARFIGAMVEMGS